MGYSSYRTLKQVATKFNLKVQKTKLFKKEDVLPVEPSEWLKKSIEVASDLPLSNEKTKSERLISPILLEIYQFHKEKLTLFSGEELNIEPENDLNGPCDFFFSANPTAYFLEAPIVSLAEAKDEDMDYGIAQCTAQMIGAQRYNHRAEEEVPVIWGCSTTAGEWKFLKLEGSMLYVDLNTYYVDKLDILLGVFDRIFKNI